MASKRTAGGRVTPKGTRPGDRTGRTTPRAEHPERKPSPMWVPILMGLLFVVGIVVIALNDVDAFPGGASNGYLLVGLGLILGGIITATQYR